VARLAVELDARHAERNVVAEEDPQEVIHREERIVAAAYRARRWHPASVTGGRQPDWLAVAGVDAGTVPFQPSGVRGGRLWGEQVLSFLTIGYGSPGGHRPIGTWLSSKTTPYGEST
jgi:hypothetical protein